jgi:hypothetical protein
MRSQIEFKLIHIFSDSSASNIAGQVKDAENDLPVENYLTHYF